MATCKLIIEDEVNIKLEGLPVDIRRKISSALKFEVPYAKHMPQYKLGRWDGKVAFFGIGGTGYVNHLDKVVEVLQNNGVEIGEIEDRRETVSLDFNKITEEYWGDTCWPEGHPAEGQPIRLRDYQVEIINNFLENPQALQEVATGAGKCVTFDTVLDVRVNSEFENFLISKYSKSQQEQKLCYKNSQTNTSGKCGSQ